MAEFCSTVNILPLFTLVEKKNNNLLKSVISATLDLNIIIQKETIKFKVNLSDI